MHMTRFLLLALALCFTAAVGFAQKTTELKKSGEKYFAHERWAESLAALEQYQAAKPGDIGVLTKIGIAQYRLHQPDKARKFLECLHSHFGGIYF